MKHNELTTYIAELKQTLLPKFHLSNESINHLNTYCRYRLGDRWEIPVSHYHFWINMANDKDSQELAIYICEPHMAKVTCFSAALSGKTKYRRIRL